MNKEFIPYEQALELKELGFNENYIACYSSDSELHLDEVWKYKDGVKVPLYQQAFRWFREKYEYIPHIFRNSTSGRYSWKIDDRYSYVDYTADIFNTYEEAELDCLNKLIEIVNTLIIDRKK